MNAQTQKQGFTIIEVVLVLAIAALIFLMIFVALPALQRGQRDTARKNDLSAIASAVGSYRSNSRGDLPETKGQLVEYIDGLAQLDGPDANGFTVTDGGTGGAPEEFEHVIVYTGFKCDGAVATDEGASSRQAAVVTKLENGGSACQDA